MKVRCSKRDEKVTVVPGQTFYGKTYERRSMGRPHAEGVFVQTAYSPGTDYRYPVFLETGQMYEAGEVEVIRLLPNAEVTC